MSDSIPRPMMGEEDGSVIGYMCLTDWECEAGGNYNGNRVFYCEDSLREQLKCVEACGIIEVRFIATRLVQPAQEDEDE